jgi:hypothetical protein
MKPKLMAISSISIREIIFQIQLIWGSMYNLGLYPEKPLLDGFSHRWEVNRDSMSATVRPEMGYTLCLLATWKSDDHPFELGVPFFWPYRHLGTTTKCKLRQQLTSLCQQTSDLVSN